MFDELHGPARYALGDQELVRRITDEAAGPNRADDTFGDGIIIRSRRE